MIAVPRARDWPGFRAALRDWAIAVFNFVYADRDGNIGYQMAGRIPRARAHHARLPRRRQGGRSVAGAHPVRRAAAQRSIRRAAMSPAPTSGSSSRTTPRPIYGAYSQGHRGRAHRPEFAARAVTDRAANIRVPERREELPRRTPVSAPAAPPGGQHGRRRRVARSRRCRAGTPRLRPGEPGAHAVRDVHGPVDAQRAGGASAGPSARPDVRSRPAWPPACWRVRCPAISRAARREAVAR